MPMLGLGEGSWDVGLSQKPLQEQSCARARTMAWSVLCSLAGILNLCTCLVCKYLPAKCTRGAAPSSSAQNRVVASGAGVLPAQTWRGSAGEYRFPTGLGINSPSPLDVVVVSTTGCGATWGRKRKVCWWFFFFGGEAGREFLGQVLSVPRRSGWAPFFC